LKYYQVLGQHYKGHQFLPSRLALCLIEMNFHGSTLKDKQITLAWGVAELCLCAALFAQAASFFATEQRRYLSYFGFFAAAAAIVPAETHVISLDPFFAHNFVSRHALMTNFFVLPRGMAFKKNRPEKSNCCWAGK
jgi:hypothetical protein